MGGYVACMCLLDLIFLTTHVNKFWVPSFITCCVLSVFWIMHFFDVPQRFYGDMRLLQLYLQSYFFLTLTTLILLLQIHMSF